MAGMEHGSRSISGAGVTLRPFRGDDTALLAEIDADPESQRWFDFPALGEVEEHFHLDVITSWHAEANEGTHFAYVIETTPDGSRAGTCDIRIEGDLGRLSYVVLPPFRGQGLATGAVVALRDHAIEALGLARLEIRCDPDNLASRRVAEKAGFHLERLDREAAPFVEHPDFAGTKRDELVYLVDGHR